MKLSTAPIADERWDVMAEEYENGTWSGIGEVTPSRPKPCDENLETVDIHAESVNNL